MACVIIDSDKTTPAVPPTHTWDEDDNVKIRTIKHKTMNVQYIYYSHSDRKLMFWYKMHAPRKTHNFIISGEHLLAPGIYSNMQQGLKTALCLSWQQNIFVDAVINVSFQNIHAGTQMNNKQIIIGSSVYEYDPDNICKVNLSWSYKCECCGSSSSIAYAIFSDDTALCFKCLKPNRSKIIKYHSHSFVYVHDKYAHITPGRYTDPDAYFNNDDDMTTMIYLDVL